MSNVLENRISNLFTKEELEQFEEKREALMDLLEVKTVALTDKELTSLGSISVDNFVFVKDTLGVTDNDGKGLLPPVLAGMVPEMAKDVQFFGQLDAEENALMDLVTRIRHTKRLVAHESYKVANAIYLQYQALSESGVPGATTRYDTLKERYKRNGGGRPPETDV